MCHKRSLLSYLFKKKMDEGTETQNSRRMYRTRHSNQHAFFPAALRSRSLFMRRGEERMGIGACFFFLRHDKIYLIPHKIFLGFIPPPLPSSLAVNWQSIFSSASFILCWPRLMPLRRLPSPPPPPAVICDLKIRKTA